MKKTTAFAIGSIAVIILLAFRGSYDSTAVNRNGEDEAAESQLATMPCGPLPQVVDGLTTTKRDFKISTFLSDEELGKFKYESTIFEMAPGQMDTVSHRHDCDVFITVLEGTLLMGQEFKKPDTVRTGEIFHERRNVIHSVYGNPSKDQRVKAFVTIIRKDGRAFYTPLYPKKQ